MTYDEKKAKFGTEVPSVISNGFVFFEGQYIEAPYNVTRMGLTIFINNVKVYEYKGSIPSTNRVKQAFLPDSITENSSFDDVVPYINQQSKYLTQEFTDIIKTQKMVEYLMKLPNVASVVAKDTQYPDVLLIKFKNGKKLNFLNWVNDGDEKTTPKNFVDDVEWRRKLYEDWLSSGCAVFLFEEYQEKTLTSRNVACKLKLLIETLRSNKCHDEKKLILQKLSVIPVDEPRVQKQSSLFTSFSASSQLDERLSALIEQDQIAPVTEQDLPEEIPVLKHERIMEEKVREAQQKY